MDLVRRFEHPGRFQQHASRPGTLSPTPDRRLQCLSCPGATPPRPEGGGVYAQFPPEGQDDFPNPPDPRSAPTAYTSPGNSDWLTPAFRLASAARSSAPASSPPRRPGQHPHVPTQRHNRESQRNRPDSSRSAETGPSSRFVCRLERFRNEREIRRLTGNHPHVGSTRRDSADGDLRHPAVHRSRRLTR